MKHLDAERAREPESLHEQDDCAATIQKHTDQPQVTKSTAPVTSKPAANVSAVESSSYLD